MAAGGRDSRSLASAFDGAGAGFVLGSRPVNEVGRRLNQGFLWDRAAGYRAAHLKNYLPNEVSFWEASWYERGDGRFIPISCGAARIGFQICTDLWFMERARAYGKAGVHLIVNPRATARSTLDKWLAGGRAAAVIAGAYCLSSPPLPDIEANRHQYKISRFAIQPGDCLVFQAMIVHGAPGNTGQHRRRALSTRWTGDDARYCRRTGEVAIPTQDRD